ncbi:hypothetical protein BDK51DRAFT_35359 [Blyttiomyces helicus]|uniref:Uncharacterized protein n=1 Tax=Blyttiomyces helicus TaxID=388810 RepID=A0A4P9WK72_9FUNG|nr:hypothetical protein BDK51DRAFT_35359 [Blyttiomyces helicus]|eukprot:RKO93369.1 hypothetical protein BDK51DRAFT_35359 [Blyttiomyces helicus]
MKWGKFDYPDAFELNHQAELGAIMLSADGALLGPRHLGVSMASQYKLYLTRMANLSAPFSSCIFCCPPPPFEDLFAPALDRREGGSVDARSQASPSPLRFQSTVGHDMGCDIVVVPCGVTPSGRIWRTNAGPPDKSISRRASVDGRDGRSERGAPSQVSEGQRGWLSLVALLAPTTAAPVSKARGALSFKTQLKQLTCDQARHAAMEDTAGERFHMASLNAISPLVKNARRLEQSIFTFNQTPDCPAYAAPLISGTWPFSWRTRARDGNSSLFNFGIDARIAAILGSGMSDCETRPFGGSNNTVPPVAPDEVGVTGRGIIFDRGDNIERRESGEDSGVRFTNVATKTATGDQPLSYVAPPCHVPSDEQGNFDASLALHGFDEGEGKGRVDRAWGGRGERESDTLDFWRPHGYMHASTFAQPRLSTELNFERRLGPESHWDNHTIDDIREAVLRYSQMTDNRDSRFELIIPTREITESGAIREFRSDLSIFFYR